MFSSNSSQVSADVNYIEDMFSTYLYTGTGATRTITNNIDLSTKGGLVWIKNRDTGGYSNLLIDTVRGAPNALVSNTTDAQTSATYGLTAFTTSGFTLGTAVGNDIEYNGLNKTFVSWTFREQPKFFDVVTYSGNGSSITVSHSLGSAPGCIIVKRTDTTSDWPVYHRSVPSNCGFLNYTNSFGSAQRFSSVTSTNFTINVSTADVNASGGTYVAYLFAHDAGGFGLAGTDNVISCGSVSATGGTPVAVNLGYEPQWLLIKGSSIINGWSIIDNMRGFTADKGVSWLQPNTSAAEVASPTTPSLYLTSTGFKVESNESPLNGTGTYIYIAIRRGPMKVPTLGTSVFTPVSNTSPATGNLTDLTINRQPTGSQPTWAISRLTNAGLETQSTNAETSTSAYIKFDVMTGVTNSGWLTNSNSIWWNFKRAPSFFDEVCYTGTGSAMTVSHNLAAVPELMVIKSRTTGGNREWVVYSKSIAIGQYLYFTSAAVGTNTYWNNTAPTASVFSIDGSTLVNNSPPETYVAYLFATCAGVSKVGSYTGTGTTKQIDCGFTAGARFVLIKRTDSTGDWYVWDSARGIVAGNDPYLLLNSTAAEVTSTDYIDTYSAGFEISSTAPAAINANGGSFIFLAIS